MIAKTKAYSFDVFDTCISRHYAYPRDIFYALAMELASPELSVAEKARFAKTFRTRRIQAEKQAYRAARSREGANIFDIYRYFHLPSGLTLPNRDILDAELEFERKSLYPIPEILEEIDRLRRQGVRIFFTSDMYLPATILDPILTRFAIKQPDENIYVSCDVGLTKHTGNLYRHVLRMEKLEPSEVTHVGDNILVDVRIPNTLGMSSRHFTAGTLTSCERKIAGHKRSSSISASSLAGLSRQSRLTLVDAGVKADTQFDEMILTYVAPLLISYVAWVLEQARASGIKRLYFVARDGEVMYKIASLWMGTDADIELCYLYGSRRAWLTPSIVPDSKAWVKLVATPGQSNTCSDILSRMGLEPHQHAEIRTLLGIGEKEWSQSLNRRQADNFIARILKNSAVTEIIFGNASYARQVALQYFTQKGLLDDVPWALVDAGWSLNCQAALKRILSTVKGAEYLPTGYYLALTRDHLSLKEAGISHSFLSKHGSLFSRRRVIIEHCFTPSTHATTRSYRLQDDSVVPVFGPEIRSQQELAYANRLHQIAEQCTTLIRSEPYRQRLFLSCRGTVIRNAERFISHPSRSNVTKLCNFGTVADLRHDSAFINPLCRPLGFPDLWRVIGITISKKLNFQAPSFMWIEGSVALSNPLIRIPFKVLLFIDSLIDLLKKH